MTHGAAMSVLAGPPARRPLGLGLAASLGLHVGALGLAVLWQFNADGAAEPGFVVEVTFIEAATEGEGAQAAPAEPASEPHEVPAERPQQMAALEPAQPIETPPPEPAPVEEAVAEPVPEIVPDPLPTDTAKIEPEPAPVKQNVVLPLPSPPRPAPPKADAAPRSTKAPPAKPAPSSEPHTAKAAPQLASAGTAPISGADDVAAATAGPPAPEAATSKAHAVALAVPSGPAVITNPRFREHPVPPTYPRRAINLGQEGEVIIRALVGPDGDSRDIVIWRSSGIPVLDEAALRAVRRWAFEAARRNGRPIEAWVEVPVRFHLRSVL